MYAAITGFSGAFISLLMPKNMASSGIAGGVSSLFASHPSMEERIAALQGR